MNTADFKAHHMSISAEDVAGNNGVGRYILLPGSDGRAASIAEHFSDGWVKEHSRRHNFYAGTLNLESKPVDVAVVATGMGCPSVDIIVNELIRLGARRLLRVGTAGSLQPGRIPIGSIVVASAAVRDEGASRLYMPTEVPAVASAAMIAAEANGQAPTPRRHKDEDIGSWDPIHRYWGRHAGRLYATALSILNLEVYYRYLPMCK